MTINPDLNQADVTDDPIVNEVIKLTLDRHMQGMRTFGKTMAANDRPLDEWIKETTEELLDAVHYLVKAKTQIDQFKVKQKELEAKVAAFITPPFEKENDVKLIQEKD